ncbi:nitrophenyl compound nitroreductase subunit ArsF family protein [Bacteroidota bacterium]
MIIIFPIIIYNSVNGNEKRTELKISEIEKIEVFYFHYSRRCATCIAVEDETKKILEDLYGEQMKNELVSFKAINLDESDSEVLVIKLEISGQTLLIVAGDKKENITTDAFMNAKTNPEKLKQIIKSKIDPLLGK